MVSYLQLAHNERHPVSGSPVARTIHNFGRADQLDVAHAKEVRAISHARIKDPVVACRQAGRRLHSQASRTLRPGAQFRSCLFTLVLYNSESDAAWGEARHGMSRSPTGAVPATIATGVSSRHIGIKPAGKDGSMRKGTTYIVMAVLLIAIVGMMGFAIGCGSSDTTAEPSASPTGAVAISGSAMERATAILGHAPTGLANDIVTLGEVVVANDSNYAPQSSVDPVTKEVVGFDVDVAKGMAEILGLGIKWEHPVWETIPSGLVNGRYDVSIGSMTSAIDGETTDPTVALRWKQLDFSSPYYYTTGQVFVRKGGTQVTGPEDLAGKKVGVAAQTTYYSWLKGNTTAVVKTYDTDVNAFPDLLNGNTDFVMTAGTTGQQAILEGKPMEFSGKPVYYEDLSMAAKKGETDWVSLLTYAVDQMHKSGALTEMSKTWYNGLDLTTKQ